MDHTSQQNMKLHDLFYKITTTCHLSCPATPVGRNSCALLDQAGMCFSQGGDPSIWPGTPQKTRHAVTCT